MSSLNKAFIKAYDKSRAPAAAEARPKSAAPRATKPAVPQVPAPAAVPSAVPPPLSAAFADLRSAAASPSIDFSPRETASPPPKLAEPPLISVVSSSSPTAAVSVTLFDAAHAGLRSPHAKFAEPQAAAENTGAGSVARRAKPTASVEIPPLISPPIILPMSTAPMTLRPVFEVTGFSWPEMIDQLLAAAPAQFRAAANDLIDAGRRHRKLVAVTAAHRGEGCTAVALALARALVEQQQHVILVDGHFDSPALGDSLGVATQVGWEDSLSGDKPLAEALVESLEDHLTVLPLRQPAADDWRVGVARLKNSLDELRRHCDLVLIDAGPLGKPDDRRHLLSWAAPCRVDRALIVRDVRTATDQETAELDERLHGCGIAQWHFVENFSAA